MNTYIENQTDIIHETSVDFILRPCSKEIHIVQYDKSLPIVKVELFRNGERFSLPEEAVVNIRFGKLDRTFVYKSILGTNVERNIVYFEVDEQMAIIPGRMWPVLEVIYSNGKIANSSPIHFIVERNPIQDDYIESEEYFPIIYELQGTVAGHETRISALEQEGLYTFNGFVGGSQVHEQIQNGQIKYCQSGTQSTIDPTQSPIINIELTQEHISAVSNKKAVYIKKIHIEYELDSEIGIDKTWEYEFTSKIFGSGSASDDINPKVVSLSDITTGLELEWTLIYRPATGKQYYGSYTSSKGQQFGSNTHPSDYISLYTTSIQNATIKNVWIEVSGNSGTTAKIKLTLVQDQWTVNDIVDPNITANNEQYIFHHEGGTHLGSGSGEIIEYNHVFLKKENDIVISISAKSEYLYIEEDSSKGSDTYRLYKYVDDQMKEVSKTRLGTTSDTAYRGDYGQDNYNKLKQVREQHFEFIGEKEFHDPVTFDGEDVAVTINGTLHVDTIGNIEAGPLLEYHNDDYVWDMHSIRYINVGMYGVDIRFLQSEYLDPLTGRITVGGVDVNQVRLLNIADPINNRDAVNKQYVDTAIENIEMSSAVIDVLGTYADLEDYDTSDVRLNDLIKVISDETHNNAISYYRWENVSNVNQWVYVASEGPYYTISEINTIINRVDNDISTKSTATNLENGTGENSLKQKSDESTFTFTGKSSNPEYQTLHSVQASGYGSVCLNGKSDVQGRRAFAVGGQNIITEDGAYSFAEGYDNYLAGQYSHIEGEKNEAWALGSHIEGIYNTSRGYYNHVEGTWNTTNNFVEYCHIEGEGNVIAEGSDSSRIRHTHVGGQGNWTNRSNCYIIGTYNYNSENTLFVVGNGTDGDHRSNAFEVFIDGSAKVGKPNGSETDLTVATKGYLDSKVDNVREVAEEKCKTIYISYNSLVPDTDVKATVLKKEDGTYFTDLDDFNEYVSGYVFGNELFKSYKKSIVLYSSNPVIHSNTKSYLITKDNFVIRIHSGSFLKDGDSILVSENNVPNRLVSHLVSHKLAPSPKIVANSYETETSTNKSIMLSSKKKCTDNMTSRDDFELSLKINLINFNDSDVGKCIYLYRKAKQRTSGLRKCYKHPKDLYISYEPSEHYVGYTYMGYKMNAEHKMSVAGGGHGLTVYTPVPTFMPREGTIQTEWILTQEDIARGYIEIDICSEWVSLISHYDIDGEWSDLDSEKWTRVVGCQGSGNCINIKFGLVNESGIMECISTESVKFGLPAWTDSHPDILYIDDINETAFIIPSHIYFEIK